MEAAYQNLWDTAKDILRAKGITINAYIIKGEMSQETNIVLHGAEQEPCKPKASRKKEIAKIRVEEAQKIQKVNKTRS